MFRPWRPPLFVVAVALIGLIVLLGTYQYQWLGRVSAAERETARARLSAGATEFAQDFDRELTRAYLLFQTEPSPQSDDPAAGFAMRYDRWQATARFPRILKDYYVFTPADSNNASKEPRLERFDVASRRLVAAEWPESMRDWRTHLQNETTETTESKETVFIKRIASPVWRTAPAIVVPRPMLMLTGGTGPPIAPAFSYTVLAIDLDYVTSELMPTLAEQHFSRTADGTAFQAAIVSPGDDGKVIYRSTPTFSPRVSDAADASADLFQVRTSDFTTLAAEVRRFATFSATWHTEARSPGEVRARPREGRPVSIIVQSGPQGPRVGNGAALARVTSVASPGWKLLLRHPAGSLDAAVEAARRRNLIVSTSIIAVLGASMGLLVLSTRRAQRLARQQMEFVATVSHELRTPLAVIRSAAENLADGVVHDDEQIRKYGEVMRSEGRRLTEMVEQILEFAGIQSGQRGVALRPVDVGALLRDVVSSSSALIEGAGLAVEIDVAPGLPTVLGDEPALRRVFQNLVNNAIKYGAPGGWIGIRAATSGGDVEVTVADRGIGIAPSEQARIFEPFYRASDVVAAQIQGAGLGLSLVQRIVQAHGGRVAVKSAPGAGSTFTVRLRASDAQPAGERVAAGSLRSAQAPRTP